MCPQWGDYRVFWQEFRHAYRTTGAILPSGPALAAALCRYVRNGGTDASNGKSPNGPSRRILEVGPGTGAVTVRILADMRPTDQLVLVERNEHFVAHLQERLVRDQVFADAAKRVKLLSMSIEELAEDEPFDVIISGLPLNNFPVELVKTIMAKLQRLLVRDGTLSFFEYVAIRRAKSLVSSRIERRRLRGIGCALAEAMRGKEVRRDFVLSNVPPAWVHHVQFR